MQTRSPARPHRSTEEAGYPPLLPPPGYYSQLCFALQPRGDGDGATPHAPRGCRRPLELQDPTLKVTTEGFVERPSAPRQASSGNIFKVPRPSRGTPQSLNSAESQFRMGSTSTKRRPEPSALALAGVASHLAMAQGVTTIDGLDPAPQGLSSGRSLTPPCPPLSATSFLPFGAGLSGMEQLLDPFAGLVVAVGVGGERLAPHHGQGLSPEVCGQRGP